MLLRISLIVAILAGIGTIVVTHLKTREHVQGIIGEREQNAKDRDIATARYKKAENNLASTSNLLNQTKATLAKTEEELNGTKQQLSMVQENLRKTSADLVKVNEAKTAAQAVLAKWDQLGIPPEAVREMMAKVIKQQEAIAALNDEKAILDRRVKELDNKIKLIVGEDYEVPLPAGTRGSVVAVDPKWNFVVLDIGSQKNILEGGILMVHRNSQLVGKVRINEVLRERSIASPLPGWNLAEIEEGDQVLYKE
jgi:archaellum component FlaC